MQKQIKLVEGLLGTILRLLAPEAVCEAVETKKCDFAKEGHVRLNLISPQLSASV